VPATLDSNRRIGINPTAEFPDVRTKPPRYVERTFDEIHCSDSPEFRSALELMIFPRVAVAALVHAPIGAASGQPVPLGWASFDDQVVARTQAYVEDRLGRFIRDDLLDSRYAEAMSAG